MELSRWYMLKLILDPHSNAHYSQHAIANTQLQIAASAQIPLASQIETTQDPPPSPVLGRVEACVAPEGASSRVTPQITCRERHVTRPVRTEQGTSQRETGRGGGRPVDSTRDSSDSHAPVITLGLIWR